LRAKKWITNNFGLKVISLALAVLTWFYTSWELAKRRSDEEMAIIDMLHYELISKKLPIQLTIVGEVRPGYELIMDGITVAPDAVIVIGPENILDEVSSARTVPLDISEYTKEIRKDIPLAPIARGITLKDELVSINIPIVKTEEGEAGKSSD